MEQNWEANWEMNGRLNDAEWGGELTGARVQIGRFKEAELADATVENWEGPGCNIGRRIGRSNNAELGAQRFGYGQLLGGATMQNWEWN
jgi:hypothetical protein